MNSKYLILPVVVAVAVFSTQSQANPILNSADGFAVLGGATVANSGNTILNGDLGVYPGTAITGFPPGIVNGAIHAADAVAQQAEIDLFAAYNFLAGEGVDQNLTGQDLGGLILTPGVYKFDTSAQLTGTLTLNALNNPNAIFVFQIGSTLGTAASASVSLLNEAQAGNVFWQVGTSATLGAGTVFDGSILADQSITLNAGTSLSGRALALNGSVTLDGNVITLPIVVVPEPGAIRLWAFALLVSVLGRVWLGGGKSRAVLNKKMVGRGWSLLLDDGRPTKNGGEPTVR
jgi:hypothetical protein